MSFRGLVAAVRASVNSLTAPTQDSTAAPDLIEIRVDGLDTAKQHAMWLTKGPDGSQPTTAVRLVDCTTQHLRNIVANKPNLSEGYLRVIESILEDRGESLDDDPNEDITL